MPMAHLDTERLDRIGRRRHWVVGVVTAVVLLIGLVAFIREEQLRAEMTRERDQAAVTADQLCDQVKRLGRRCEVSPPPVPPAAGRSIKTARTVDRCYVLIKYTDGTSNRIGPFCGGRGVAGSPGREGSPGAAGSVGPPGSAGADGVSITSVTRDDCDLIIGFSNGTTVRTGPWCVPGPTGPAGPAGRGVDDVDCIGDGKDSHWVISYSDGTTKTIDKQCDVGGGKPVVPAPQPTPQST